MVKEIRFCKFKRFVVWTKGPSLVRKVHSVLKKASRGTRRIFRGTRCAEQASVVRDVFSEEHCTGKGIFLSGVCCIRCRQCSPFSGSLKNSVPERASWGTEYARGAKNRLLGYAAHFQGHSVRRTGFSGTEGIFGTGNALLWYGVHLQSYPKHLYEPLFN